MKNLCIFNLLFMLLFSATYAQRAHKPAARILLNSHRPAVFLSYIEQKVMKTSDKLKGENYLFFKITNNTRWKIWLSMSGTAGKEFGQASLYYAIEDPKSDQNISGSVSCHVCSTNPLGSGRSIIFMRPSIISMISLRIR